MPVWDAGHYLVVQTPDSGYHLECWWHHSIHVPSMVIYNLYIAFLWMVDSVVQVRYLWFVFRSHCAGRDLDWYELYCFLQGMGHSYKECLFYPVSFPSIRELCTVV